MPEVSVRSPPAAPDYGRLPKRSGAAQPALRNSGECFLAAAGSSRQHLRKKEMAIDQEMADSNEGNGG